jgi:hypothetical protein
MISLEDTPARARCTGNQFRLVEFREKTLWFMQEAVLAYKPARKRKRKQTALSELGRVLRSLQPLVINPLPNSVDCTIECRSASHDSVGVLTDDDNQWFIQKVEQLTVRFKQRLEEQGATLDSEDDSGICRSHPQD